MKSLASARIHILAACVLVIAAACGVGGIAQTPSPSQAPSLNPTPRVSHDPATPSPTPRPSSSITVTSAAQAAALVFASDPRWSQMAPPRSDVIGQSSGYDANPEADGYAVNIWAGAGDCQAGCIERREWHYRVSSDGRVELLGEEGDDVNPQPNTGGEGKARISVTLDAGPVCPVEQIPPDPNCAPRAVADATLQFFDPRGDEIATAVSDADGVASFEIHAGAYYVIVDPVQGLMDGPDPQAFAVPAGGSVDLVMGFGTGIR